ncbi:hypothetical protein LSCM1_03284 [Leishmania martiniquensis]|uniref:Uncharacterized protein n=1 Tax=Leishmania martiniquensis TaxID=1580590 RepID=A0A836H3H1_9TRYP|nr:hypothetical protein LSCM1_03284 [Leishmania martiniquensis]
MDRVQELLARIGEADVEGGRRRAQTSSPSPSTAVDAPSGGASAAPLFAAAPRRTKTVFIYSDEDDGEDDGVEGRGAMRPESGVVDVLCDHAIAVSGDALAELQAEAAMTAVGASNEQTSLLDANRDANSFSFEEDVVSGLAGGASAPLAAAKGMRVSEVTAPRLWEGAVAPAASSGLRSGDTDDPFSATDETHSFLRRGLPVAELVLRSRRKRFREMPESGGAVAPPSAKRAAAAAVGESAAEGSAAATELSLHDPHSSSGLLPAPTEGAGNGDGSSLEDASDSREAAVEEELDVYPVYTDDGQMVRALRTRGGYELTLDERDLLEDVAEGEGKDVRGRRAEQGEDAAAAGAEEGTAADDDDPDADIDDVLSARRSGQLASSATAAAADADLPEEWAEAGDWGDLDDLDEEGDEEEAELDEAIVVAVVEQLVRCCEADDLDPQMGVEAARFVCAAKPLLEQLTNETISPTDFVQRVDRDLRRFQRIYRSVYRPRDVPIVIDGAVTDL